MSQPLPCDGTGRRVLAAAADAQPGLTDSDVARWCGVERSLVAYWRSGERSMPAWAVGRVLRRLPAAGAASVLAELAPEGVVVRVEAPDRGAGLLMESIHAADAASTLARIVAEAQQDGRVDTREAREIHQLIELVTRHAGSAGSSLRAVVR